MVFGASSCWDSNSYDKVKKYRDRSNWQKYDPKECDESKGKRSQAPAYGTMGNYSINNFLAGLVEGVGQGEAKELGKRRGSDTQEAAGSHSAKHPTLKEKVKGTAKLIVAKITLDKDAETRANALKRGIVEEERIWTRDSLDKRIAANKTSNDDRGEEKAETSYAE